jgi:diguanylate cyclase (GGDEF)-like protein
MKTVRAFCESFADRHTYDLRTNLHLWFGLLWGLPVPFYYLLLTQGEPSTPAAQWLDGIWMRTFFMAHPVMFGMVFGALGSMRARLERENERLIGELRAQAWVDPLTGLYNRRYVMEEFRNILKRAIRSGDPVRAALFDLDGFKAVNDKEGHLAGDRVLQKAAMALRDGIRQGDLLGRFGGDEFLLVATGDAASVQDIVERCRKSVLGATGLSISAGIAEVLIRGEDPESLIRRADADLAASKQVSYETKGLKRRQSGEVDDKR